MNLGQDIYKRNNKVLSKKQFKEIIQEQINTLEQEPLETDPLEAVLELLENVLSEVQIDAGAYDEPKRSYRSGYEESDRIRAQTASHYIEDLTHAVKILTAVIQGEEL